MQELQWPGSWLVQSLALTGVRPPLLQLGFEHRARFSILPIPSQCIGAELSVSSVKTADESWQTVDETALNHILFEKFPDGLIQKVEPPHSAGAIAASGVRSTWSLATNS